MYYNDFIEALKDLPITARVVRWRKRGEHLFKSALMMPVITEEGPQYNFYTNLVNKIDNQEDIFIIACWPVEDCVKIMTLLYSYKDEIKGEV